MPTTRTSYTALAHGGKRSAAPPAETSAGRRRDLMLRRVAATSNRAPSNRRRARRCRALEGVCGDVLWHARILVQQRARLVALVQRSRARPRRMRSVRRGQRVIASDGLKMPISRGRAGSPRLGGPPKTPRSRSSSDGALAFSRARTMGDWCRRCVEMLAAANAAGAPNMREREYSRGTPTDRGDGPRCIVACVEVLRGGGRGCARRGARHAHRLPNDRSPAAKSVGAHGGATEV